MARFKRIAVDKGWEFKQASHLNNSSASSFLPVSQFPTVSHIDLLHHGLIPDPYIDDNETKCLWVNEADWTYRTLDFPWVDLADENARATLVFEGLDTVVDIFLDGEHILSSKNMHLPQRVDVTALLRKTQTAPSLELRFRSAPAYAREEKSRIGYKGPNETDVHFGGPERLFLRKAQYHWGWDWGPAINTCGPWKPIYLQIYEKRIDNLLVRQQVLPDLSFAVIRVRGTIEQGSSTEEVTVKLQDPDDTSLHVSSMMATDGEFDVEITVQKPRLWYPHSHGEQPLYKISVELPGYDQKTQLIGLRRLRLLQHSLKNTMGTAFVFEINNIRLFSGGSCWIPGDFMLPRMNQQRYSDWLKLAKSGNQTMVRVWGGGIVESDDFYDICDQEGILVWQDFLFACGNYPASPDFLESVEAEAEAQLRRVGHHASLVLWAGNNEDYLLADRFCWDIDYSDENGPWDKTNFPAREIYERLLPRLVEEFGGDVPYWRSSPYGGSHSNDPTIGDTHVWDVWHGKLSAYQDYKSYTSRFISEFGFESCPSLRTLHRAITVPSERHSQSRLFDIHDKGPDHTRRYPMYMGENFRFRMNPLRDFVYCTQFLQAEAMAYAYNCWRREFRGPEQEYCAGVLVWQLNDIWPGTTWALADDALQCKPAFFITKRALAKVVVGMERTMTKQPPYIVTGYPPEKHKLDIWAVNGTVQVLEVKLKLCAFDIQSGSPVQLSAELEEHTIQLAPNRATEIMTISIPNPDTTVVAAYLDNSETSERLARWISWPEPLRLLHFSPDLRVVTQVADSGDKVLLSANAPAKGVTISVPMSESGEDACFGDNFVDLVPGETVEIEVSSLKGRSLQTRFLYDWEMEQGFEL